LIYRLTHITTYMYESDVSFSQNEARLRPQDKPWQECREWSLKIDPAPSYCSERVDPFGNHVHYLEFEVPHRQLEVRAISCISTKPPPASDSIGTIGWEEVKRGFLNNLPSALPVQPYLHHTAMTPDLAGVSRLMEGLLTPGRPVLEIAMELCHRIHREFRYDPSTTTVSTPLGRVLAQKAGVCQDFAHLMIAALRQAGLAARYASGYLETLPPPGKARLVGADASHAWISVWCPPIGWVDIDPTNDCLVGERHIVVGWGRDYADVCPWKGLVLGGGRQTITVSVDTAPMPIEYSSQSQSQSQWQASGVR
jgi:transglutaminase-like putative cysteine protease